MIFFIFIFDTLYYFNCSGENYYIYIKNNLKLIIFSILQFKKKSKLFFFKLWETYFLLNLQPFNSATFKTFDFINMFTYIKLN